MDFFIKASQLLMSLSILIVLHELGHFIPAKLFKTRVEKFYLFFDPWFSVVKKKIGDTVYGIGWLPLGGYVKMHGDEDEASTKKQTKNIIKKRHQNVKKALSGTTCCGGRFRKGSQKLKKHDFFLQVEEYQRKNLHLF